jgi:surface polysaccharide O-acyltransferase-like enzyme
MLIILVLLACVPLLSLECLRWHFCQDNYRVLRKAFWLAFTSSVFWAFLGDYVSTVYDGWSWFFYLLLIAGVAFTGTCAWKTYEKRQRRRNTALALLAYVFVFSLAAWLVPDSVWITLRENVAATGSLSHWRGPLH